MAAVVLSREQEQQAQALASRIRDAVDPDILQLARLLVSKNEAETFGQTEFEIRDIVHHLGAAALQTHLGEKKRMATAAPASLVPIATKPRSSRTTGRKSR
jgi:hypothetical protein